MQLLISQVKFDVFGVIKYQLLFPFLNLLRGGCALPLGRDLTCFARECHLNYFGHNVV